MKQKKLLLTQKNNQNCKAWKDFRQMQCESTPICLYRLACFLAYVHGKGEKFMGDYEVFKEKVFQLTKIDLSCYKERQMKRRIDALINNAGISMRALLEDLEPAVLRKVMDVNFWGTVYCTKYALPYLQAARGTVVGVSSVAGLHGLPGRTGYSASKYAMTGFLDTVRIENRRKGVHVMVACPGFTATNVRFSALTADGTEQGATPRKEEKMMTAEEVAHRIAKGIMRRKRLLLMEFEGRATHFIKKFSPRFLDMMFYKVMAREPDSPFK